MDPAPWQARFQRRNSRASKSSIEPSPDFRGGPILDIRKAGIWGGFLEIGNFVLPMNAKKTMFSPNLQILD